MEIRFDRDLRHNYMVLCGLQAETDYRLRMLSENVPAGLLRCSLRNINAQIYLYYEIDSRQPMRNRYADGRLSAADLKRLLRAVLALGGTLEDYLLDIEHVLFSVDCIYVDIRTGDFFFAYCPYSGEDLGEQGKRADFASFTEELLPFLNPSDEEAARIAYTLCGEAGNGGMLIRDMIEAALREGNAETAEALRVETGTAGAEVPPWQSGEPVRRDESGQSEIRAGLSCAEPGVNGSCASTGFHPDTIAGGSRSSVRTDGDIDRVSFSEGTEGTCDSGKSTPAGGSVREIGRFLPVVLFAAVFAANLVIRSRFYLSPEEKLLSMGVAVVSLVMAAGSLLMALKGSKKEKDREEPDEEISFVGAQLEEAEWVGALPPARAAAASSGRSGQPESFDEETTVLTDSMLLPEGRKLYGVGGEQTINIPLNELPLTVGKMAGLADFVIRDPSISRIHARFLRDASEESLQMKDLNSTNGTFLNGRRLRPNESVPIRTGDEIGMGSLRFELR